MTTPGSEISARIVNCAEHSIGCCRYWHCFSSDKDYTAFKRAFELINEDTKVIAEGVPVQVHQLVMIRSDSKNIEGIKAEVQKLKDQCVLFSVVSKLDRASIPSDAVVIAITLTNPVTVCF